MKADDSISTLKGVGPKKENLLARLGISTVEDLLLYFPRDYQDRTKLTPLGELVTGEAALTKAIVMKVRKSGYRRGHGQMLRVTAADDETQIEILFFNARWIAGNLSEGNEYYFYGVPKIEEGRIMMIHPEFSAANIGVSRGILPIYPLTAGIGQKEMRRWTAEAVGCADTVAEYMPAGVIADNGLCSIGDAVRSIHFPADRESLTEARKRFMFDELFIMQLGFSMMKGHEEKGISFNKGNCEDYQRSLPYELTGAQKKAVAEIEKDMASPFAMNRLLQGDVGSGKTVVAEAALYKAVMNGYQGAFMAPTDILMHQHFEGLTEAFRPFGITVGYLSGHMSAADKKETLDKLAAGEIDILTGTHAMIQSGVNFKKLGIVITDEQHRFGVSQRGSLTAKGSNPDVLVMTATPIPRTLAVVVYGDLDISAIDEMPPGRKKILTKAVTGKARDQVYSFAEEEMNRGRQIYVVAPLIEESDMIEARSATEIHAELSKRFRDKRVELMHGELRQKEKDEIMAGFYAGDIDMLVSTVVIEVGINVPNATVMIIEDAERFGLAQLHQLRGRVGRGSEQSYCLLITEGRSAVARERARVMVESDDGFYIAERDLQLRGPGEIFGTRQHGLPDMKLADPFSDMQMTEDIKKQASKCRVTPELRIKVEKMYGQNINLNI